MTEDPVMSGWCHEHRDYVESVKAFLSAAEKQVRRSRRWVQWTAVGVIVVAVVYGLALSAVFVPGLLVLLAVILFVNDRDERRQLLWTIEQTRWVVSRGCGCGGEDA